MHPNSSCTPFSASYLLCISFTVYISCAALQAVFVVAYFKHNFLDRHLRNHVQAAAEVCLDEGSMTARSPASSSTSTLAD